MTHQCTHCGEVFTIPKNKTSKPIQESDKKTNDSNLNTDDENLLVSCPKCGKNSLLKPDTL